MAKAIVESHASSPLTGQLLVPVGPARRRDFTRRLAVQASLAGAVMPVMGQICATGRTITDEIANGYWLHTPKFGSLSHFQRWRFVT